MSGRSMISSDSWQMKYQIGFKPRAIKDLKSINKDKARRIIEKIALLKENLQGDIKRLTSFT